MKNRLCFAGLICVGILLALAVATFAQTVYIPPTYPVFGPDPANAPFWVTLENAYVRCNVGIQGNIKAYAFFDDNVSSGSSSGRGDKVFAAEEHDWGVSGRYGVVSVSGDPDVPEDGNRPLTFMGMYPCHYFAYWKLRIGTDMRMIGDSTGSWFKENLWSPPMTPTKYDAPPPDLAAKEPALGRMGPFIRGIWTTKGGNGSEIRTEIRIHLVRDLVRYEYRITNKGTATEKVGFQQVGDVETGDPAFRTVDEGGYYGPYDNSCFAFVPAIGASKSDTTQRARIFGVGSDIISGKPVPRLPVPAWIDYYDNVTSPLNATRNVLNQEDATKPDYVAIGEYNDLYHKDLWIPTDYKPDFLHAILDMAWVLCWDQKDLKPGATRTIVTYYGVGSATSRWTYSVGKNVVPDSAVAAVEAPRSLRYNSTSILPGEPELSPSQFSVKAWVYNLATDPGPFDLTDTTATISLPPGLELVPDIPGNTERKEIGLVIGNSESLPVEWQVRPTGEYSGELSIYVSIVDNSTAPGSTHWQQTVVRKIYVPAVKRGVFHFGWQLMHVPFNFNDFRIQKVFNLVGAYGAKYWDPKRNNYFQVDQVKPGQGFWINVGILNWGETQPFFLDAATASIVGEAPGTGTQTVTQSIPLSKGWNMIGNPFVYPMYWGQALVYSSTSGGQTVTLDEALRNRWLSTTLFSYNPDKAGYDTTSSKEALLDPWKGYWVYAYQPITLILRAPAFPGGDVTANPGGQ